MYVVLLISKDNLFAQNQSPNMCRSILMFVYRCVRFELVWYIVVSSAKRMYFDFLKTVW